MVKTLADDSPYDGAASHDGAAEHAGAQDGDCARDHGNAADRRAAPGGVAEAIQLAEACLDYLNSPAAADLGGSACGEVLVALGAIQAKLTAAHAAFLRRFDAADAHDADGYGSSAAWLAAKGKMSKRDARAAVRRMRQFGERSQSPDPDDDGMDFKDRYLRVGTTFGGAGVIRGDLTPECAAAVTAVLDALGKRRGPEDDRSADQRFHDALQEAWALLMAS